MIIVKLQGGLGNQMFQYAFGLSLSQKHQCALYLDTDFFDHDSHGLTLRHYELDVFNIYPKIAGAKMAGKFLRPSKLQRVLNKAGVSKTMVYREPGLRFNEAALMVKPPAYFEGFWQSEQYFDKEKVRQAFAFSKALNQTSNAITAEIAQQKNPVSIHIRRGDYVSSKTTNELHGVCSLAYYQNAIARISEQVDDPHFYIFSDDTRWVEQNLLPGLGNARLVHHNQGADNWQDMALMSKCNNHIIANSSFSWWGAWLGHNPEKVVIAPKTWFKTPDNYFDAQDMVPNNWLRIDND